MGRFQVRQGSLVDEGDLLTTLSDNSTMWVYFNVSEAEYLKYKAQPEADKPTPVKLVMANGQVFDQPGKVETIEADFNNETGNIAFRATFPNPKGLLRHGETGKILMTVPLKNALLIPQKATFDVLDKKFVFVVDEKNVVRSRADHRRRGAAARLRRRAAVSTSTTRSSSKACARSETEPTIAVDFKEPAEVLAHLDVPAE